MRYFDANATSGGLYLSFSYPSVARSPCDRYHAPKPVHIIEDAQYPQNSFISQFSWNLGDFIAIKLNSIFPENATLSPYVGGGIKGGQRQQKSPFIKNVGSGHLGMFIIKHLLVFTKS